ncbi:MAG: NAD-dependent epimerase/dehydratase family protein [Qingshengfaniella sp.]
MTGSGGPIVLLGGAGRVGRLLRRALAVQGGAEGVRVQARIAGPGIDLVWQAGDDPGDLTGWLADLRPRLVVCLWGKTGARGLDANTTLALTALAAAGKAGVPRSLFMSSAAVYGALVRPDISEAMAPAPANAYGVAKLAMEQAVAAAPVAGAMDVLILRLANVIGADMLADAVACATPEAPLRLDRFADGTAPRRSYASPMTVARLVRAMADRPVARGREILNLADGPPVAMDALLQARAAAGAPVPWSWRPAPDTALPVLGLATDRLLARVPELAGDVRLSPEALVADWLALAEARP